MFKADPRTQARFKWAMIASMTGVMVCGAMAQAPVDPQFDPSDVYFQAYLDVRAAEQLERDGDFMGALKRYEQAGKLFESVGKFYPDWKSEMVQNRRELTKKAVGVVRDKAGEQFKKEQGVIAELEGGVRVGARPEVALRPEVRVPDAGLGPQGRLEPEIPVAPAGRDILQVDPLQARRLKDAEAELERLRRIISQADAKSNEAMRNASRLQDMRKQNELLARQLKAAEAKAQALRADLSATPDTNEARGMNDAEAEIARLRKLISQADAGSNQAMRNAARLQDMQKQNDSLSRQLKAAETNVRSLRAEMAGAPVRSEITALNNQIEKLEQEREAMGMALRTSRGDHTQALSKIEILTADMEVMREQARELRQAEANLNRDLKKERDVANDVVKGQRRQMEELEKALGEKSKQLEEAHGQIVELKEELDQSREAFDELREERDGLLQEREQMVKLLKLSEADRTQELIEQNMGLAKLLREANEKVERLNLDNNAAKDDVVDALRDLAIAKSQINRLQQEKRDQAKRLEELTERLKGEERALARGEVNADPAEVEMLREVIRRQLTAQERRRQAKEIVIEAAKQLGQENEQLGKAIELLDGDEVALTPEEQKLVANQQVDGEFISPFARDRTTVGRATAELNREMESYDRAATKAYLAGRLLPTRELFEMMVEQNPGHVPALCKLGVVQLKLEQPFDAMESFRKAVELDESNPYANRMLGYANLKLGDVAAAERHLKHAVDLAPDDAKSYHLLGVISNRLGESDDAEDYFKSAISADPVSSGPYFNLALLYANSGRIEDAREYYNKALEREAVPDQALERKLEGNP
jgi:Flp pilus assembly protein TadD